MGYLLSEAALLFFRWWVFQQTTGEKADLCEFLYVWVYAYVEWRFKWKIAYKKYIVYIKYGLYGYGRGRLHYPPSNNCSCLSERYTQTSEYKCQHSEAECHVWFDVIV